jgi:hypothetical protein
MSNQRTVHTSKWLFYRLFQLLFQSLFLLHEFLTRWFTFRSHQILLRSDIIRTTAREFVPYINIDLYQLIHNSLRACYTYVLTYPILWFSVNAQISAETRTTLTPDFRGFPQEPVAGKIEDSPFSIATRLRAGWLRNRGSIPGRKKTIFSSASRPALGSTQPPLQWVPGAVSPGIKRRGLKADHSPLPSAEDKNGGAIPQLHHVPLWRGA